MISTIRKKLINLQGLSYTSLHLVNIGLDTAENGWRVFAHIPKFSHWETLPALLRHRNIVIYLLTGGATGRALDLRSTGCGLKSYSGQKLRNNLGQVVHTHVPLSPSSINWYRPRGGDALRLGR